MSIMSLRTHLVTTIFLILFIAAAATQADPLVTGDSLPETTLPDQHGKAMNLHGAQLILFAPGKAAGETIHEVLGERPQQELAAQGIIVISDISRMPGLVTRLFALPTMRDYSYRIMLGYEAEETAWLPREEDSVTRLTVQDGRITGIEYAQSAGALRELITPDSADPW
ncbi:MAG: hypothetical protein ABW076_14095 [Candidatus Thiodiazotropha sp.]